MTAACQWSVRILALAVAALALPPRAFAPPDIVIDQRLPESFGRDHPVYTSLLELGKHKITMSTIQAIESEKNRLHYELEWKKAAPEVYSRWLDTRRKAVKQWLWELENVPTPAEVIKMKKDNVTIRRAQGDPPVTEIWAGTVLNDLLADCQKLRQKGIDVPDDRLGPFLTQDQLAKINVTGGFGNVGLLKGGKLFWPLVLRRSLFDDERERIDVLIAAAVKQANNPNGPDAAVLEALQSSAKEIDRKLVALNRASRNTEHVSVVMYIEGRRFLTQFGEAMQGMRNADAGKFLSGDYAAKGANVKELVSHMTTLGLKFAGATPGGHTAYTALHRSLAAYSAALREEQMRRRDREP